MAETTSLLTRQALKSLAGSNPALSAKQYVGLAKLVRPLFLNQEIVGSSPTPDTKVVL